MGTNSEDATVTVDDRGRITLPKAVRERLQLGAGDELTVDIETGEIHLRPDRPSFQPIESGKNGWGDEAFLDTREAMAGDPAATEPDHDGE
jgi:AbrB family looped-hinge helix DNA binding protein